MKALITGAAGYLGSTIASAFLDAGDDVVLLDDLSGGAVANLADRPAYLGDIADTQLLDEIFFEHPDVDVLVHCAARTVAPESVSDPLTFYRENVAKSVTLFQTAVTRGCSRILFSSSAAVYAPVALGRTSEQHPLAPATPYGRGKVMTELMLDDLCRAYGCSALSLRYFNPVGVDPLLRSGPSKSAAVLPTLLSLLRAGRPVYVHGSDWPTRDGTPLRDFVDVWDLARAHVAAARRMPRRRHEAVNLGSGIGITVGELAAVAAGELAVPLAVAHGARRAGEHDCAPAAIGRATALFGWRPQRTIADSVRSAICWENAMKMRATGVRPASRAERHRHTPLAESGRRCP